MKDFNNIEIIEAYIEGNLIGPELEEFEQNLKTNEEFNTLVTNSINTITALKFTARAELKKNLQQIHLENTNQTKSHTISLFLKYAAIFIAVLSISTITWLSISNTTNYTNLYSSNFEAYTNLLTIKGENGNASLNTLVNNAMYQYDLKNYEIANQLFEQLISLKQNNDTVLFYYGISSLGSGETTKAIELFSQLLEQEHSLFHRFGHAKWYLSLALIREAGKIQDENNLDNNNLAEQNIDKSRKYLEEIVSENGDYSKKAKKILNKIK